MQLIINIVFLVVLAIAFLGFWGLYLYLWKPKKTMACVAGLYFGSRWLVLCGAILFLIPS